MLDVADTFGCRNCQKCDSSFAIAAAVAAEDEVGAKKKEKEK